MLFRSYLYNRSQKYQVTGSLHGILPLLVFFKCISSHNRYNGEPPCGGSAKSIVIGISYPRYTRQTVECITLAKKKIPYSSYYRLSFQPSGKGC